MNDCLLPLAVCTLLIALIICCVLILLKVGAGISSLPRFAAAVAVLGIGVFGALLVQFCCYLVANGFA